MSIVALGGAGGTLQHEFFHLTVRSTFGDIPQWLDEGLASLYEVSRMTPDTTVEVAAGQTRPSRFVGLPNWRGRILSELQSERSPLEQMITSNWFAFEQPGNHDPDAPDARHMAVTLAEARYFTLYLQDRGMLKPLYERLRSQVPDAKRDAGKGALAAVADVTQEPLDRLDHDFIAWFNKLPKQPQ